MSERKRLPNRRLAETFAFEVAGLSYVCTAGRFPDDGRVAEIFLTNHKAGSTAGIMASDAAVVASIALHHGVPLETIRRALMRDSKGRASGPLGAALDRIADDEGDVTPAAWSGTNRTPTFNPCAGHRGPPRATTVAPNPKPLTRLRRQASRRSRAHPPDAVKEPHMRVSEMYPSKYLSAADLQGREHVVEIDRVVEEEIGRDRVSKQLMYFRGRTKALVLNKTIVRAVAEFLDDETDEWRGQRVTLFPTTTQVGDEVKPCVRVKAAPAPKPPLADDLSDEIPF
jgi:hypothetical protein